MLGTGTVTLLFTDLVGSTESLVALGEDRYDSMRDEHEVLVAGTIAAYHGEVVKSTGDGYMGAFRRAGDAIAAAGGDLEGSLRHAHVAIDLEPASAWTGLAWSYKFLALAMARDLETCRTLLSEQRGLLPQAGEAATIGRTTMLFEAAQGCVILGLAEDVAALYPLVAERVDVLPVGAVDLVLAQRIAGMAAAAAGGWDQAQAHFEVATQQSDEFPNRLERPQVLHWYGKMLLDRANADDHERARTMLADALNDYRQLSMPVHASITQALLQ